MRKRPRLFLVVAFVSLVAVLAIVGSLGLQARNARNTLHAPVEPSIYLPPQFLWTTDKSTIQIPIPLTSNNPGPTIQIIARHERGFESRLTGSDLPAEADTDGRHVLATIIEHMQYLGWKALLTPTRTDSFPSYALYVTFQAGQQYCFVEYHAAELDQLQAFRSLDVYLN